jgi:hypothetical protein
MTMYLIISLEINPWETFRHFPHSKDDTWCKVGGVDLVHLTLWELNRGPVQHMYEEVVSYCET